MVELAKVMTRPVFSFALLIVFSLTAGAISPVKKAPAKPAAKSAAVKPAAKAPVAKGAVKAPVKAASYVPASKRRYSTYRPSWGEPTFADSTIGDRVDGEDLVVRRAAIEALGPYNGSVMVTDPETGRVLTMVNQRVALKAGFTPCSTIKLVTSMAGLIEGVLTPQTTMRVEHRQTMDLSMAIAKSSNIYFSNLGKKLGFERVAYYSRLFGLGEKAGFDIEGEQPGVFPDEEPINVGGVGGLAYTGSGVQLTPLQLTAVISLIANNGKLPWLQYPRTREELAAFEPKVKRQLDLAKVVDQILPGMQGTVDYGSGKRARQSFESEDPIWGKTGTCTHNDARTHLGWFGSYNHIGDRKLVVVVLLTGGSRVNGPVASGIAGSVYRILSGQNYYAKGSTAPATAPLTIQPCCATQN